MAAVLLYWKELFVAFNARALARKLNCSTHICITAAAENSIFRQEALFTIVGTWLAVLSIVVMSQGANARISPVDEARVFANT